MLLRPHLASLVGERPQQEPQPQPQQQQCQRVAPPAGGGTPSDSAVHAPKLATGQPQPPQPFGGARGVDPDTGAQGAGLGRAPSGLVQIERRRGGEVRRVLVELRVAEAEARDAAVAVAAAVDPDTAVTQARPASDSQGQGDAVGEFDEACLSMLHLKSSVCQRERQSLVVAYT